MDKGQHLRLVFVESNTNKVIALATEMTLHLSAQTEDSTTKDTTDTNGDWNEYEVTQRSGDISFGALIGVGTDASGKSFADMINQVSDAVVNWKVVMVSGANNRVVGKTVCSGQGKLTNLQASAQNRQKATYSGTLNIYGPVTVGSD
jgi:hypothetical protein